MGPDRVLAATGKMSHDTTDEKCRGKLITRDKARFNFISLTLYKAFMMSPTGLFEKLEKRDKEAAEKIKRAGVKEQRAKIAKKYSSTKSRQRPKDDLKSLVKKKLEEKDKVFGEYDDGSDEDALFRDLPRITALHNETPEERKKRELEELLADSDEIDSKIDRLARVTREQEEIRRAQHEEGLKQKRLNEEYKRKRMASPDQLDDLGLTYQEIYEKGKARGYPTTFREEEFKKRCTALCNEIGEKLLAGEIESPFYDKLKQYSLNSSKLRLWMQDLIRDKIVAGAGYYGPRGLFLLGSIVEDAISSDVIRRQFKVKANKWMTKYEGQAITRGVVCPHIIINLIMEDRNIPFKEALDVLEESFMYGNKVFPDDDNSNNNKAKDDGRREKGDIVYAVDENESDEFDSDDDDV